MTPAAPSKTKPAPKNHSEFQPFVMKHINIEDSIAPLAPLGERGWG